MAGRSSVESFVCMGVSNPQGPAYLIGVSNAADNDPVTDLGEESPFFYNFELRISDIAVVNERRPLTGVTHEFFHQLHYYHAGLLCGDAFPAVSWPPDDRGDIQGIGLDRWLQSPVG